LFSFGLCFSLRGALVDGPSLLLLALGMRWIELGHPWRAALTFGVAGLGKETNTLAAAALAPLGERSRGIWMRAVAQAMVVALPLALWGVTLWWWLGSLSGGA